MTSMTWIKAPADLLGLGRAAARPCTGIDVAVSPVLRPPVTPVQGTGLPFGGTAAGMPSGILPTAARATAFVNAPIQLRPTAVAHNYIAVTTDGTPLGIHPSRRPQS